MENKIIVELQQEYLSNNKINKFLNADVNECLICYNNLDRESIILINNFCECYKYILLCDKCFINWALLNSKCFICHVKYINGDRNSFQINIPILKDKIYNNSIQNRIGDNRSIVIDINTSIQNDAIVPITSQNPTPLRNPMSLIDDRCNLLGQFISILGFTTMICLVIYHYL
jgi:hypothetical protein